MSPIRKTLGLALFIPSAFLIADTTTTVSSYADLVNAISSARALPADSGQFTIQFTQNLTYDGSSATNLFTLTQSGSPIVIDGGGFSLDMQSSDRAFFVVGGSVTFKDLEIANALAQGGNGGGGGMGAGGAIFVADGASISNDPSWAPTEVTLQNVTFTSNQATGGNATSYAAGGGGMGGDGGESALHELQTPSTSGGGGGFGQSAQGGNSYFGGADAGSDGEFLTAGNAGASESGQAGGDYGGGGGGFHSDFIFANGGGGGGVGGQDGGQGIGGQGGWGGGGGSVGGQGEGADGGFGGGGGWASDDGGDGGFGGGGAKNGAGGFGAGDGNVIEAGAGQGGGGLGAGGAIFAMKGVTLTIDGVTFNNNSTTGGSPSGGEAGMAIGNDLFFGSDVVFNVADGETLTITDNSFGGAGFSGAGDDPTDDAKGSLTLSGGGEMIIQGAQSFSGTTYVDGSTLTLAAAGPGLVGHSESGSYQVYNPGATLNVDAAVTAVSPIAQSAGVVNINGSENYIGPKAFTPESITNTLDLSGGQFNINGANTAVTGATQIDGGTLNIDAQGVTFSELVTLVSGELETSEPVSMNGFAMQGGSATYNDSLTNSANLTVNGGTFRHVGVYSPTGASLVAVNGGKATFLGGDNGASTQYQISGTGEGEFAGSFANSAFIANTPTTSNVTSLRFIGASASSGQATAVDSIEILQGATMDLQINGDVGETIYAVSTNDLTIYEGAQFIIDLYSTETIPLSMAAPEGTLSFEESFIPMATEFLLDAFGDTLAPGESRTYTIIGSVQNLDLNGQSDILSTLSFNAGENTNLSGVFSGLDNSGNKDLMLTITNNVPEPGHYAAIAGLAILGWVLRRRSR